MGFLRAVKITQMDSFSIDTNTGSPALAFLSIAASFGVRTLVAALVVSVQFAVLLIACTICDPQIFPGIVILLTIFVVNLTIWPFACHVEPRKAMGAMTLAVDAQMDVTVAILAALRLRKVYAATVLRLHQRVKMPAIWIVTDSFFQSLYGEHLGHSHV
jgi:hypothetical protein